MRQSIRIEHDFDSTFEFNSRQKTVIYPVTLNSPQNSHNVQQTTNSNRPHFAKQIRTLENEMQSKSEMKEFIIRYFL